MPLIQSTNNLIRVSLTDRKFNDTVIKQDATFAMLEHRQDEASGIGSTNIAVTVKSFANDNGRFGIHLNDKGMPDKTVFLVADNDTVVDAQTGEILAIKTDANRPEWEAIIAGFQQDIMYQGDFFIKLRENIAINIGDMIRQHILQADQMGKFA